MRAFKVRNFAKKFLGSMIRIWCQLVAIANANTKARKQEPEPPTGERVPDDWRLTSVGGEMLHSKPIVF